MSNFDFDTSKGNITIRGASIEALTSQKFAAHVLTGGASNYVQNHLAAVEKSGPAR